MKALVLEATDGPQCAVVKSVETAPPRAGEIVVAVQAAALNHRELWITRGQYPGMIAPPFTLGCDGAGVVEAVGEGVERSLIGQAVVLYPGLDWGAD
jgi:zinc-binding alcohol dehydrogenase/oxidoreductase